jgi:hypothetical protein
MFVNQYKKKNSLITLKLFYIIIGDGQFSEGEGVENIPEQKLFPAIVCMFQNNIKVVLVFI